MDNKTFKEMYTQVAFLQAELIAQTRTIEDIKIVAAMFAAQADALYTVVGGRAAAAHEFYKLADKAATDNG